MAFLAITLKMVPANQAVGADTILFHASEKTPRIVGTTLPVDGGVTADHK